MFACLPFRILIRSARGQVGTVVEQLDDKMVLVEFSDDRGGA
jgi:hypothetical protein